MVVPEENREREADNPAAATPAPPPYDPGLRRMIVWTLLAFLFAAVVSLIAVTLAIHYFDRG